MPTNLNALIRYKIIDECLSNPQLSCTIEVLMDKCSEKLSEHQGINSISERTIRNDIRILRSDALGFNAPIVINQGVYSYTDLDYYIFGRPIYELDVLKDIQRLLVEEIDNIKNENTLFLIKQLSFITKDKLPDKYLPPPSKSHILESKSTNPRGSNEYESIFYSYSRNLKIRNVPKKGFLTLFQKPQKKEYLSWGFILDIL